MNPPHFLNYHFAWPLFLFAVQSLWISHCPSAYFTFTSLVTGFKFSESFIFGIYVFIIYHCVPPLLYPRNYWRGILLVVFIQTRYLCSQVTSDLFNPAIQGHSRKYLSKFAVSMFVNCFLLSGQVMFLDYDMLCLPSRIIQWGGHLPWTKFTQLLSQAFPLWAPSVVIPDFRAMSSCWASLGVAPKTKQSVIFIRSLSARPLISAFSPRCNCLLTICGFGTWIAFIQLISESI